MGFRRDRFNFDLKLLLLFFVVAAVVAIVTAIAGQEMPAPLIWGGMVGFFVCLSVRQWFESYYD